MIKEKLFDLFNEIYVFDTEFIQDIKEKGERPNVVCAVYKEIKSGKIYKYFGDDLKKLPPHSKRTLWVAFNVVAEASCLKALNITLPLNWWDCFVENKKLYQGRINGGKGAYGLLRTAKRYGIDCMSEDLKNWNIDF